MNIKINNNIKMAKKTFQFTPSHEKFCQHYSEYGNATQAFLFAWPKVTYNTAKAHGYELLQNVAIKERIEQLKEEFAVEYKQTKDGTIRDLIQTAEEAKAQGQFSAYAKLREMIIRMCGFYEPDKLEVKSEWTIGFNTPSKDEEEEEESEE